VLFIVSKVSSALRQDIVSHEYLDSILIAFMHEQMISEKLLEHGILIKRSLIKRLKSQILILKISLS